LRRRFGDAASIEYVDVEGPDAQALAATVREIQDAGLLFPVTLIDGEVVYDGAVSYPAILRQVETRLGSAA
jgi:disulfide oxidoreductase YuzD